MRILAAAVPLAALIAFPLFAAKPPAATPQEVEWEAFRGQLVASCTVELRTVVELTPDDLESICSCAFDRLVEAQPPASPGRFRGRLDTHLTACTAEVRPDLVAAVARRGIEVPQAVTAPPVARKPLPDQSAAPESEDSAFDLWAWLRGFALPAWLAALPAWAWILLGLLAVLLIGGLLRRRDEPRHLLGPPPSMRRGGPPIAPRLPNPPPPR